jgi:hypothetical protein
MRFTIINTKVRTFDNNMVVVVCLENIETTSADGRLIIGVIANNIFEQNEQIN